MTLARRRPDLHVTATDIDLTALQVAQLNAKQLGASIECLHGSWWQPVAGRRFQLAVSNPPYIDENDPHLPNLRHEPRHALTPGGDGLAALRQIVCGAPAHLQPPEAGFCSNMATIRVPRFEPCRTMPVSRVRKPGATWRDWNAAAARVGPVTPEVARNHVQVLRLPANGLALAHHVLNPVQRQPLPPGDTPWHTPGTPFEPAQPRLQPCWQCCGKASPSLPMA